MLVTKPVVASSSKVKAGAKAKIATRVGRPAMARLVSSNNLASEPIAAGYMVREQRVRSERAIVASLLDQPEFASDMEMVNLIHNRLSLGVIDRLLAQGVTKQELNLVAPARTLAHRRANAEPLTIEESDRAVRLARVVAQADAVFGNQEKAMNWLRHSLKRFEGRTPLEMLATDVGSRLVEEALAQIDEGFYA